MSPLRAQVGSAALKILIGVLTGLLASAWQLAPRVTAIEILQAETTLRVRELGGDVHEIRNYLLERKR